MSGSSNQQRAGMVLSLLPGLVLALLVPASPAWANQKPLAWPDSVTTNEDVAITVNVLVNDSDPDGDPLRLTWSPIIESPSLGTATRASNSSITYTPFANVYGTDQFRYRITDGNGAVDSALVTVTVNEVNDKPVAVNDSASTGEEQSVTINVTANDSDVDGDWVRLISNPVVSGPSHGTAVKISGSSITYTPYTNFSGTDSFQYEVGDGRGARARAWVTVTVNGINDAPEALPDAASTDEDVAVTVTVTANDSDPDGDTVKLALSPIIEAPTQGTAVRLNDSQVRYTPDPDTYGTDQFRYRVTDGNGAVDSALVTITVNEVNDAPVVNDDAASTPGGTAVTIVVTANDTDVDGDTVRLITDPVVTPPGGGTAVKVSGSSITYTPDAGFVGSDSFVYEAGDGRGARGRATVTVTVANRPPEAQPDAATLDEDGAVTVEVTANDSDPDGHTVLLALNAVIEEPEHGTAARASASSITYTPDPDFAGSDQLRYRIHDGEGGVDSALLTLTVNNVNDKPVATDDAAATHAATPVAVDVTANDSDVDGDTVTLITDPVVSGPDNGTAVKLSGSSIEYTPDAGFTGSDSFQYEAGDGNGARARAWVTVQVSNDPPLAADDAATTEMSTQVVIPVTANDSDPDGDTVRLTADPVVTPPAHGTVVRMSDDELAYTPDTAFDATDTFVYQVTDGNGGFDEATVTVTVSQEPSDVEVRLAWNGTEVKAGSTVHLPDVDPGQADSLLFEIHNVGAGPLEVRNWESVVSGPCFHQIEDPDPVVRLDQPVTTFRVRVQCAEAGNHAGQVTLETNDPDEPTYVFAVRAAVGLTLPPIRILDPQGQQVPHDGTYRLPDTGVGQPVSRRLRIVDDGGADLGLADPAGLVRGVGFSQIEDPANPVPGSGETGFRVRLHHNAVGTYHGDVVIETTDPAYKPYRFKLVGEVGVPDFAITAEPSFRAREQGFSAPYLITLTPAFRFASPVALSVSGLPAGATAAFSPAEVVPEGTSMLWVHTDLTTPPGRYDLTVTGSGGGLTHSTVVTLRVDQPVSEDFELVVAPSAATVVRGGSVQFDVTLTTEAGFSGSAALTASGLPAGAGASFQPASVGADGTSVLTITTDLSTPESSSEVTVTGTAGSETRTATIQLVVREQPAPGEPVIDSISPELVEGGGVRTFTLLGQNFQGAAVTVATEQPDPDNPVSRVFPDVASATVNADGTRIDVQVDCTDPAVMDFYNLVVDNGVGQASSRVFRVLPQGPVVDLVTPNQPERGSNNTYVLALGGYHLSNTTVRVEPAGALHVFGVEATDDQHVNGLLRAPDDAPLGPVDLVVTDPQGREARITLEIVGTGMALATSRTLRTQAVDPVTLQPVAGPSPSVQFQQPGIRLLESTEVTPEGHRAAASSSIESVSEDSFTFSVYFSYTLELFRFHWARAFTFDPVTNRIGDEVLKGLGLGERVRFGALVLAFYLEAEVRVEVRITNTGFTWPRFCFVVRGALQIPGVEGFYFQWDYCRGGGAVNFNNGSTNDLHAQGGQCAAVAEEPVQPIEGLVYAEAEQLGCCDQPIGVSGHGTAFAGSWFPLSFNLSTPNAGTTTPGQPCTCSITVAPACVVRGKTRNFQATGQPPGGSFSWRIPQGGSKASIDSGASSPSVTVRGNSTSSAADDVELEVTYVNGADSCTTSVNLSVVSLASPHRFTYANGSSASLVNDAAHGQGVVETGLPSLGMTSPGNPSASTGWSNNMELMAMIEPCDPALRCEFDFKRERHGVSANIATDGQSYRFEGGDCSQTSAWCNDDARNDDEDLALDAAPHCSLFVVDTPGPRSPVSPPTSAACPGGGDAGFAHCFNFREWLEVDGVSIDDALFHWHASTRVRCVNGTFIRVNEGSGNKIGPGHIDCSQATVLP